jgi:hypothetical protein
MVCFQKARFYVASIGLSLAIASCKNAPVPVESSRQELLYIGQIINSQILNQSQKLSEQLSAFSKVIASDREFSMKLLVENNRSAPEVTEAAVRYMEPMGLSILEISDSQHVLLSCGEFEANAGTSIAGKEALLGEKGVFIEDAIKGKSELTMQAKAKFKILDGQYYCCGGFIVDDKFLKQVDPGNGFKFFFKQGQKVFGLENAEGLSNLTDSTVVMNAKTYPVMSFALPIAAGSAEALSCIVLQNKPLPDKK